ncbi:MAG: ABC transporter permease subunit [Deinococcus-Thermus bacterium]|nr:ABC transporter permease subunit [Deinococcota bacterium]
MLLFGAFVLLPLGASFYYGFTHWDGISPPEWVGLRNYVRAVGDGIYLRSYLNVGLYIAGTIVVEVGFGLVMAALLNVERRGFALMRVLFFSPMVLSMVAAGLLWAFVYDLRFGLLNGALAAVGLDALTRPWLSDPRTALAAVTIVSGWKYAGFYMIIYLAALRRIPVTLYEAARLDGAGPITQFFRITLPLLRETTVVTVLLCVTGGFAAFDLFFAMTNGGPFNATEIPTTWIVKQAFDRGRFGYGIALTVIMALVVGVLSIVYLRLSQRGERVEY